VGVVLMAALILVGVLVWGGSPLLLDAWWKRRPTVLVDRLMLYQRSSMAEEAQRWLDEQS
jgi:hypothetical protein